MTQKKDDGSAAAKRPLDLAGQAEAPATPSVDDIVDWFNAWLREPITDRERVIVSEVVNYALKYPAGVAEHAAEHRRLVAKWGPRLTTPAPIPSQGSGEDDGALRASPSAKQEKA